MTDFSHLANLNVTDDNTAEYVFYDIKGTPKLFIKPAGQSNKGYYNALLKASGSNIQRMARKKGADASVLDQHRKEDRVLYSKHVISNWENVKDKSGADVPFSVEACEAFLNALPNYMFDELRAYAGDPRNFIKEIVDAEEVGKN